MFRSDSHGSSLPWGPWGLFTCFLGGIVGVLFYHPCMCAQLCLTLCDPMDCSPPGYSVQGILQAKNTGVGCHALLQEIFLTQGSNLSLLYLLHWQVGS